ncbi:MAG: hypothetical protein JSU60_04670 [Nitrospirota bacterium]|nr:MAG: hypothetical protein JSU60_04670 [Nitrospirota bacterium]
MKYSALGNVCVGIVCMMVLSCSNSEVSTAPESPVVVNDVQLESKDAVESIQAPNLTTYLQGFEDKLGRLKDKHAKLVSQAKEAAPGSKSRESLDVILEELTKKGEEVQFQIEALKSGKGEDLLALQTGMDKTLADLDQSYDKALAEFAG